MSYVNENIRVLRNRMGLTQEKFAELMGINRKAIGAYEENRATPPLDKLNRMASLFGISLDQLTQYRFAVDTPLFEASEEIPAPEEPVIQPEKKRPFSRTGHQAPVFEALQENAVRYISHKYFDRYILDADFESRLAELPVLSFPFGEEGRQYRAFDVPAYSSLEEGIVIGERLADYRAVTDRLLVVSLKKGIFLGKLENASNGEFTVKNEGNGSDFTLRPEDIREVWKPVGFFSRTLPRARPDLAALVARFNALKTQFDALL